MLLIQWDVVTKEEVLQAGMWMGYSQLLCCSGEQMLPGSLQVIMLKVAQSRELWSKPWEAEMWSCSGENVHKEKL